MKNGISLDLSVERALLSPLFMWEQITNQPLPNLSSRLMKWCILVRMRRFNPTLKTAINSTSLLTNPILLGTVFMIMESLLPFSPSQFLTFGMVTPHMMSMKKSFEGGLLNLFSARLTCAGKGSQNSQIINSLWGQDGFEVAIDEENNLVQNDPSGCLYNSLCSSKM